MTATTDPPRRVNLSAGGLLDADELAELLKVKRGRVYELARRLHDPLPSVRLGRSRRFELGAIEEWLGRQAG